MRWTFGARRSGLNGAKEGILPKLDASGREAGHLGANKRPSHVPIDRARTILLSVKTDLAGDVTRGLRSSRVLEPHDLAMSSTGINDLAAEILSYIFELHQQYVADDGRSLLDLACVCKYWKETAFGHPQLWCRVYCSLRGEHRQAVVDALDEWLGRAGDLPITFDLTFDYWPMEDSPMVAFFAHCSTLETLRLHDDRPSRVYWEEVDQWYWLSQILRAAEELSDLCQEPRWPILTTFEMDSVTDEAVAFPLPTRALAPRIKNLAFHFAELWAPEIVFNGMTGQDFSWSTLSSLCIRGICEADAPPESLIDILRRAVNLERVEVQGSAVGSGITYPQGTSTVTHLKLQHLSLELDDGFLKLFFAQARFPALRSMQLKTKGEPKSYSRFLKWSLEDQCKDPDFWPMLEHFKLILGNNVLEVKEGDPGFPILKQGPWTWWILAGTPYGMP